jgi:hypothetical protein
VLSGRAELEERNIQLGVRPSVIVNLKSCLFTLDLEAHVVQI